MAWINPRGKRHLTAAEAIDVFRKVPGAVLTRAEGMGFFTTATMQQAGASHSTITFRSCESLVRQGMIQLRDASRHAGYWIATDKVTEAR